MATTPYVRIPYASEQDRYTGRAYTAQQLALMQRRDASESAYARDRAQRMSDRWSGFGGLVTETLGDLRQSREVREAQALEQSRYDERQARLDDQDRRSRDSEARNIHLYDSTILGQQAARIRERTRAGGELSEADAETMRLWDAGSVEDYERPASEQATLASVAAPPPAEMGDRAFGGVQFGEPFGAPPVAPEIGDRAFANALPVEGPFGPDAPRFGPDLVAGTETVPATPGTRLRMTAEQGEALGAEVETNAQYHQQRALSIKSLRAGLENGVLTDTQATFALANLQGDGTLPSAVMTKLMDDPEEPSYATGAFASIRDSLVQQFKAIHGTHPTGAALQDISIRAEALANPETPTSNLGTSPRNLQLASGEEVKGAFLVNDPVGPYWVDPDLRRIEEPVAKVLPASEGLMATFTPTMTLRDRWIQESASANQSALQYELMKSSLAAAKAGGLAAGSQGILVTFQKILDPGSVVRESEYERSSSGLSLWKQLEGRIQTAIKGGAGVPIKVLEEYVALAREFAENQAASTEKNRKQINAMARTFGLDQSHITNKVEFISDWNLDPTLSADVPDLSEVLGRHRDFTWVPVPGLEPTGDYPGVVEGLSGWGDYNDGSAQ